jgi:hypothetical protein
VKIAGMPGRLVTVLAGATVLAASAMAGGPAAAAPQAGHRGPWGLARLLPRGIGSARLPGHALAGPPGHVLRARDLPRGGQGLPEPGAASLLEWVFCPSSSDCWAVGTYNSGHDFDLNEVLHWNGSAWAQVPAPSPAGSVSGSVSILLGVRCASVSDCWAVGFTFRSNGPELNQALHWNGNKWSVVPTPQPGGSLSSDISELADVGCTSSASCWAAGQYGTRAGGVLQLNELLHWNGKKWSLAAVPQPGGTGAGDVNALNGVRCTSPGNCLAVGTYGTTATMFNETLHWTGTAWSQVAAPSPGGASEGAFSQLNSVTCSSATNCWAVGSYGAPETSFDQALHWNGTTWSQVPTPEPGGTSSGDNQELIGISCHTATNCWTVGDYEPITGSGLILDQALHWDGGTWSQVDTPEPGGAAPGDTSNLVGVRCNSATDCWAVGRAQMSGGSQFGQALHWNGTTWSSE